jgi:hypothetical protein
VGNPPEPRQCNGAEDRVIRLVKQLEAFAFEILRGALSFPQILGLMAQLPSL